MGIFLTPLLKGAVTKAASSAAAGKLVHQLSQQASELAGGGGPTSDDRTRFLVWLRGDFRKRQPEAFDGVWAQIQRREQWRDSDGAFGEDDLPATLAALTAIWLQLEADAATRAEWFRDLGEADADDFATLIEAARPRPSELQQRAASLIETATEKARDFDPTTERGRQRADQRAETVRNFSNQLLGRRRKPRS